MGWQRSVNGFELVGKLRGGVRALVFRCTHYDPATRRCDSYDSRPFMCRDYPGGLLNQTWPELFEDCSYTLFDRDGGGLAAALDGADLSDDVRAALKQKLRLVGLRGHSEDA